MGRDGRTWEEMGRDGKRWKEMGGDGKRWKEMGGDGKRWKRWEEIEGDETVPLISDMRELQPARADLLEILVPICLTAAISCFPLSLEQCG